MLNESEIFIQIADDANEAGEVDECLAASSTAMLTLFDGYEPERKKAFKAGLLFAAVTVAKAEGDTVLMHMLVEISKTLDTRKKG